MTLIELLAQTGPLVSGAVGVGGGIVAGAAGGWISTWATNRATRQRQASDHEHTKNLADARVQAETTAALRADRARLYTDIYDRSPGPTSHPTLVLSDAPLPQGLESSHGRDRRRRRPGRMA